MNFSFLHNHRENFTINDVWDGSIIYLEKVSKWVTSKMKSIASCIGVDLSGYEKEVAQLLSDIEKKNVVAKPVPHRTPPAVRRQRELRRLKFGVNYG